MRININSPVMQVVLMIVILPFVVIVTSCDTSKNIITKSPDNNLSIRVNISKGQINYAESGEKNELIVPSHTGLDFGSDTIIPSADWKVGRVVKRSADTIWNPVGGKSSIVPDQYNETTIELRGPGVPFDKFN